MGDQCSQCMDPNTPDNLGHKIDEPIYSLIETGVLINEQDFPKRQISEEVESKMKDNDIPFKNIEKNNIWKFDDIKDQEYVGYLTTVETKSKSSNGAIAKRPQDGEQVVIYLFKESENFIKRVSKPEGQEDSQSEKNESGLILDRVFKGELNKRMSDDKSVIVFPNGETYKGWSKNLRLDGANGVLSNKDQSHKYEGQWTDGKPHGNGKETLKNQYIYEGQFDKEEWQGRGELIIKKDGKELTYQGEFVSGQIEGEGTIKQGDKVVYRGEFKNGVQHGHGEWWGEKEQNYEGDFVEGRMQGKGKYIFEKEVEYEGEFVNGQPHGEGELNYKGNIVKGIWNRGENIFVFGE